MNKKVYFPEFTYEPTVPLSLDYDGFTIKTWIRKQQDGIWYDWQIVESASYPKGESSPIIDSVRRFIHKCYMSQILGVVDTDLQDFNGLLIHKKSDLQISEKYRLRDKYGV